MGVIVKPPTPPICWLARSCCRAERTEYYVTTHCRHCSTHLGLLLSVHVVVATFDSLIFSPESAEHQRRASDSVEKQELFTRQLYKMCKDGREHQLIFLSTEVVFMLLLKTPCSADHRFCGIASSTGVGRWTKSSSEIETLSDSLWASLEMGRIEKRKTSESEVDGGDGIDVDGATPVFKPGFFVPCHPLLITGISFCQPPCGLLTSEFRALQFSLSVILYGLYLTIASAFCPNSCLPDYLPIASFAGSLGRNHQEFAEWLWWHPRAKALH